MKNISGLVDSLNVHLKWNKARMDCFVRMLLGLFACRTVNLQEIALGIEGKTQVSSRYRRLQRFFCQFEMDFTQIARWIFKLYFRSDQKFYVLIDRTNWYWGKKKINVFMLSIAYEGMAIPLFWRLLPKAGSSNFEEQKALITRFIKTFGTGCIHRLLADREFASGKFFHWLNQKDIPFCIRIKEGATVCVRTKKFLKAQKLFSHLKVKKNTIFDMKTWVFGQKVYLSGSRSERGELMIVATNANPKIAIASYLRRWEIENLFQCLKTRGFHFEDTRIFHLDRLEKLTALLAIGFVWAHKIGEWKSILKPIIWKQFRDQKRPQYSYFRYGLDSIREIIFQTGLCFRPLHKYFSTLLPPAGEVI
jgi:hypothetical protein